MANQDELHRLREVLDDESQGGFFQRRRAAKQLAQLAYGTNGVVPQFSTAEARDVIEGLVAGFESVHWGTHRRCKRTLETLQAQPFIEAVCDILIERELPRLRDIAVPAHYQPHDPVRKAAYLFVLGRQQFYEAHDPRGDLLEQFYVNATAPLRDHLLGLARSRGDRHWPRILLTTLHAHSCVALGAVELEAALEFLPTQQHWEELWMIVQEGMLSWSWRAARQLAEAGWQPTEARVAACWADLMAAVYHLADPATVENPFGQERAVLPGHTGGVTSVAFSPDGTTLASGSDDHTIRLWDVAQGQERAVLPDHTHGILSVAFSPDGTTLASGSYDKTVRLWDVARGQQRAVLPGHTGEVRSVAFNLDGTTLASGSGDRTVRLWDVARGQQRAVLPSHTGGVTSVAFSPDGTTLASGSRDNTIRLWDVARGQQRAVLPSHTDGINSVAFSPDGRTLASGSDDDTIRLWDVARGQPRVVLPDHTDGINSVAFSPDGRTLASGSDDKTIYLWDVARGQERAMLPGHTGWVWSVAFSPDGITLASGSWDHTIRLWEVLDLHHWTSVPVTQLTSEDLALAQRVLAAPSASAEEQAVARYVAAILRYRLGEGTTEGRREEGTRRQNERGHDGSE